MQSLEEENESLKRQMNRRSSSATNLQGSSPSMIAFHGRQGTGLSQEFTLEDELQNAATPPDDDESEVCFCKRESAKKFISVCCFLKKLEIFSKIFVFFNNIFSILEQSNV